MKYDKTQEGQQFILLTTITGNKSNILANWRIEKILLPPGAFLLTQGSR